MSRRIERFFCAKEAAASEGQPSNRAGARGKRCQHCKARKDGQAKSLRADRGSPKRQTVPQATFGVTWSIVCPAYKYDPDVVSQPLRCESDSVEFWARKYKDPNEHFYIKFVNGPHTDESLDRLFYWKIGARFYGSAIVSVNRNFISKRELLGALPDDISAEDFLARFSTGGSIYRIFWLHCCYPNKFPIYDQHVHRSMAHLKTGSTNELEDYSPRQIIDMYLGEYLPFYATFSSLNFRFEPARDGVRGRKADRALWWFGKCLKTPKP